MLKDKIEKEQSQLVLTFKSRDRDHEPETYRVEEKPKK